MHLKRFKLKYTITFIFFISLLTSCAHTQNIDPPRESFIFVKKSMSERSCANNTCLSVDIPATRSSASAFVVKTTLHGSYVVTAGHVCRNDLPSFYRPKENTKVVSVYKLYNVGGKQFSAVSLTYNMEIDACLMFSHDMLAGDVKPIRLSASKPEPGDKVYNLAAPIGIWRPGMVPILEGRFNGNSGGHAFYSIPASPGSSGSMIINEDGHLIGLLHSVYTRFPIISLSTRYEDLTIFIFTNIAKYDMYMRHMISLKLDNIFEPE